MKNICSWCLNREQVQATNIEYKRRSGGGRGKEEKKKKKKKKKKRGGVADVNHFANL